MNTNNPNHNPETSPVFYSDEVHQPFAKRVLSALTWIILVSLVISIFLSWFHGQEEVFQENVATSATMAKNEAAASAETSTKGEVKEFVEGVFSAITGDSKSLGSDAPTVKEVAENVVKQMPTKEELIEEVFDRKILDDQGQIAGDIQAVRSSEGGIKSFNFTLKEDLTPTGKPQVFSIPEDEVKVVQNGDIFFIQLNKEQTIALAKMLYGESK